MLPLRMHVASGTKKYQRLLMHHHMQFADVVSDVARRELEVRRPLLQLEGAGEHRPCRLGIDVVRLPIHVEIKVGGALAARPLLDNEHPEHRGLGEPEL